MENLYVKNYTDLTEQDFKLGFALKSITIDYPKMFFPTVKITYLTNNPSLNLVEKDAYPYEVSFEVPMDKNEALQNIDNFANASIADTIKYLLLRQPNILNAVHIMSNMPTSLYQNKQLSKEIIECLPKHSQIAVTMKPVFDKKKQLIDEYKANVDKIEEKKKEQENSYSELVDNFNETFGDESFDNKPSDL